VVDNNAISTWNGSVSINDTGNVADTLSSLTRDAGETVSGSPYDITAATFNALTGTASGNYDAPTFTGTPTLTITPASLTASIANQSKVYGTNDPALSGITVNLNGVVDTTVSTWNGSVLINNTGNVTDTLSSLTRDAGETVSGSPYDITAATFNALTGSASGNYDAPSFTGTPTLTITAASLTGSIANQSKVYGTNDPALSGITVTLGGVVNTSVTTWNGSVAINNTGDVATTLSSLTRTAGETVSGSPYDITAATFNALTGTASGNYDVPTFTGTPTLTITPASLTATFANQTKVYGESDPLASGINVTLGGVVDTPVSTWNGTVSINDTGNVVTSLTGVTRQAGENVDTYDYTSATFAPPTGTAEGNYAAPPTFVGTPTLTITPAGLTITADSTSKTYGQTVTFTGTEFISSGLQFGETVGTVTLNSTGAVNTATVAGSPYPIVPSNATGGTFNPLNYTINYVDGQLTVLAAPASHFSFGQPYTPFFDFSAQFNANANYIPFFVQTWFPLFDALRNKVLVPLPPNHEPQWVYTFQSPGFAGYDTAAGQVIGFGSSFTVGQGGSH